MCQKAFGNYFAPLAGVPLGDFAWTKGEPGVFRSSELVERGFCHGCGTPLFFRYVVKDRIWSYESPTEGFKGIDGFLSFYAGPWECFVDGEKVEAQPGDFYGGWMTQDIERSSVKGAPGTRGW